MAAIANLPKGYAEGLFDGRRYGVTLDVSKDGRRRWLWAEELGGGDRISFNLYLLGDGQSALRPCEMPASKVIDFVMRYEPNAEHSRLLPPTSERPGRSANDGPR